MTSEEGGAHLRISFWYLLINLKNNHLFKKNCLRKATTDITILHLCTKHFDDMI